jgi:hypothetical protein
MNAIQGWRPLNVRVKLALLAGLALLLCLTAPRVAEANTITVDLEGEAFLFFGGCSLRRALENHNAKGQPNEQCAAGSGNDTIDLPIAVSAGSLLPEITGTLTIEVGYNSRLKCSHIGGTSYLKSRRART